MNAMNSAARGSSAHPASAASASSTDRHRVMTTHPPSAPGRPSGGPGRAAGRRTGSAPCGRLLRTRIRRWPGAKRKVVISIIEGQANGRPGDDAWLTDQGRTREAVVHFSGRADRPKGETVAPQGDSQSPASRRARGYARIRLGLTTPVLSMVPGAHASWEVDGTHRRRRRHRPRRPTLSATTTSPAASTWSSRPRSPPPAGAATGIPWPPSATWPQ